MLRENAADDSGEVKPGAKPIASAARETDELTAEMLERMRARQRVYLSKEEYDKILEEDSDDAAGRARKRIKSDVKPDCFRMNMLGPSDEGIVLDCSADLEKGKSPRHAIKKLLKSGDGLSNPTPQCRIEISYVGKLAGSGEVFDDAYATEFRTMHFKEPSMPKVGPRHARRPPPSDSPRPPPTAQSQPTPAAHAQSSPRPPHRPPPTAAHATPTAHLADGPWIAHRRRRSGLHTIPPPSSIAAFDVSRFALISPGSLYDRHTLSLSGATRLDFSQASATPREHTRH